MAAVEPTQLFFAYAHRTDNYWASRYLLTFASVDVCREWWGLIQSEYPDQAIRLGPQLFSFQGDNFPSKPCTSKKFEHLNAKWFYTQFGDATGTAGRHQDIVPLQDSDGNVIGGVVNGSGGPGPEQNEAAKGLHGIDIGALADSLQKAQGVAEQNNAQIAQLTDNHTKSQERIERMQDLIEGNAQQLKKLTESQVKAQQQSKVLLDENAKLLRELQKVHFAQNQANGNTDHNDLSEQQVSAQGSPQCAHDVHPPPRKIDKHLVGYAYGHDASKRVKGAKRSEPSKVTQH
ncbi:uncharacterized protein KY384_004845 [Bacidia gigantensis]|uniref:uncharacterized protein n=1 Tax=Bacidia gigantensis TaxID=2732470 RepID=UPI001D03879E|nr:uncharacterized protein KY384_004845 [Bacidia gigantensis]KAG8530343.1 hypothetical protein KY384_004845 [Bacidia gigantensis]